MSKKKAFFRIGQDKAATTSLGDLISNNRQQFKAAGYYTPIRNTIALTDKLVKKYNLGELDFFDPELFYQKTPEFAGEREAFDRFMANPDWQNQNLFFSTETFWGRLSRRDLSKGAIRDQVKMLLSATAGFFENHDLKIIIHLRRSDRYFESLYNHRIKVGFADTTEFFFSRPLVKALPRQSLQLLDLLEEEFGRENIIIKPFERDQFFQRDALSDMLKTLGIADHIDKFKFIRGNEALHRALAEALFVLNPEHGKKIENRYLQEISNFLRTNSGLKDEKRTMSKAQRLYVIGCFGDFYDEVSKRYFKGRPLFHEAIPNDEHMDYALDKKTLNWIQKLVLHCHDKIVTQELIETWVGENPQPKI